MRASIDVFYVRIDRLKRERDVAVVRCLVFMFALTLGQRPDRTTAQQRHLQEWLHLRPQ